MLKNQEEINDIRSNIIETLLRLFKQFHEAGEEVRIKNEKHQLYYAPVKGLFIEGCIDKVHVKDYRYSSVSLGEKISAYHHVPYTWLQSLLEGEQE